MHPNNPVSVSDFASMQVYSAMAAERAAAGTAGTETAAGTEMTELASFGHQRVVHQGQTKAEKKAAKLVQKEATAKMRCEGLAEQSAKSQTQFAVSLKNGCESVVANPEKQQQRLAVPLRLAPGGESLCNRPFKLGPNGRERDMQTTEEFVLEVLRPWGEVTLSAENGDTGTLYLQIGMAHGSAAISVCPPSPFAESKGMDKKGTDTKCLIYFNTWQARKALSLSWEVEKAADDARKQKKKDDAAAAAAGEAMQTD